LRRISQKNSSWTETFLLVPLQRVNYSVHISRLHFPSCLSTL